MMGDGERLPFREEDMGTNISLVGGKVTIDVDRSDFYEAMLKAIVNRVFELLGPEFDKRAYLKEVEGDLSAVEVGQELSIPVAISLSLDLGYCLGQLKAIGMEIDCDKALEDLYALWKARLKEMLREEMVKGGTVH
jgi:hypothetical protein